MSANHDSMPPHAAVDAPSAWVARFLPLLAPGGAVLDLACGSGRHARLLARHGCRVRAVDRDATALERLRGVVGVDTECADLEDGVWAPVPVSLDAIVVTNYLHRPLLPALVDALAPGGVLIYETFMQGNERFGKPSSARFLLAPGELLAAVADRLTVVAFEQGEVAMPRPAMVQRICARHGPPAGLPACSGDFGRG